MHGDQFLKAIDIRTGRGEWTASERFAELAHSMAAPEEIARKPPRRTAGDGQNCDVIPHEPPKPFWQALQLCYFIQLIPRIESDGHSVRLPAWTSISTRTRRDVELEQTLDRERTLSCCTAVG
ncbi:pyruvate formate lyase family protein [Shigella flexneri]